jgi:hypothetical protein
MLRIRTAPRILLGGSAHPASEPAVAPAPLGDEALSEISSCFFRPSPRSPMSLACPAPSS